MKIKSLHIVLSLIVMMSFTTSVSFAGKNDTFESDAFSDKESFKTSKLGENRSEENFLAPPDPDDGDSNPIEAPVDGGMIFFLTAFLALAAKQLLSKKEA